jgi:hypothetical protein
MQPLLLVRHSTVPPIHLLGKSSRKLKSSKVVIATEQVNYFRKSVISNLKYYSNHIERSKSLESAPTSDLIDFRHHVRCNSIPKTKYRGLGLKLITKKAINFAESILIVRHESKIAVVCNTIPDVPEDQTEESKQRALEFTRIRNQLLLNYKHKKSIKTMLPKVKSSCPTPMIPSSELIKKWASTRCATTVGQARDHMVNQLKREYFKKSIVHEYVSVKAKKLVETERPYIPMERTSVPTIIAPSPYSTIIRPLTRVSRTPNKKRYMYDRESLCQLVKECAKAEDNKQRLLNIYSARASK